MMTLNEWQTRQPKLRASFRHILGAFPERELVHFDVLDKKIELSEVQRKCINHHGRQVLEDGFCPDEQHDNPLYRRLHIRYPGAIEGQPV